MATARGDADTGVTLRDPRWVVNLFSSTEWAWVWLIARVYVGWEWVDAGWHKVNTDAWVHGGTALKGAWQRMATVPETGSPPVAYDWYRAMIKFMLDRDWYSWFGPLVAYGELLVGVVLILGALTGIVALLGIFMNWNFAMGGMGPGTNALMIVITVGIFLAWKTAGWWGLDRWLLPLLGTPWQKGVLFRGSSVEPAGPKGRMHPIEQWVRMLLGAAVAIYALAQLNGTAQVVVLLLAGAFVAVTGLGWFPLVRMRLRIPAARRA